MMKRKLRCLEKKKRIDSLWCLRADLHYYPDDDDDNKGVKKDRKDKECSLIFFFFDSYDFRKNVLRHFLINKI